MKKFNVRIPLHTFVDLEVEAENEKEAAEMADYMEYDTTQVLDNLVPLPDAETTVTEIPCDDVCSKSLSANGFLKYPVGSTLWTMFNNKPFPVRVVQAKIIVCLDDVAIVSYELRNAAETGSCYFHTMSAYEIEKSCFWTRNELITSLQNQ